MIRGDCVRGLRDEPSDSIDLVVTSPPYDTLRDFGQPWTWEDFTATAEQLWRTIKPGGVVCWQVADEILKTGPRRKSYSGSSYRQCIHFQDLGFLLWDDLIAGASGCRTWIKRRYGSAPHHVFVLSKGEPTTVNILRDRRNKSVGSHMPAKRRLPDGNSVRGMIPYRIGKWGRRTNIWLYAPGRHSTSFKEAFRHPAIMIEALCRDLILTYSRPGDLVCDPFGGSGTTAATALLHSRRYLSWEINPEYYDLAMRRIAAAKAEYRLYLDRTI